MPAPPPLPRPPIDAKDGLPVHDAPDRAAWRAWLAEHHATAPGVWLAYAKVGSGLPRLPYGESVEEALCFGWIDSRPSAVDATWSLRLFTPRRPASAWSRLNKQRVERLAAAGLMAPAGLAAVEAAKASGHWSALDEVEELVVPGDLAAALAADPPAAGFFSAFPPSSRKSILAWIAAAKRPETRAARIEETVRLAREDIRANQWHGPKGKAGGA